MPCVVSLSTSRRSNMSIQKNVKNVVDLLSPAYMDKADKALYQAWVKEMGGSHALAVKLLVSDEVDEAKAEKLVFSLAQSRTEKLRDGSLDTLSVHDVVMGETDRFRERELSDIDFRTRLDAKMYQALHVREDHKMVEDRNQVDWESIHDYSDIKSDHPLRGAYMGKKPAQYFRPTRHKVRKEDGTLEEIELRHGGGLTERWIPNLSIRILQDGKISKERLPLTDFGPWSIVSERKLFKEFSNRWFNQPNRLGVAKIPMSGEATRWGAVMLLPTDWCNTKLVEKFTIGKEKVLKDGQLVLKDCRLVLVCPMSKDGHDKYAKSLNRKTWPKTKKLILGKGHDWITLKKVSDGVLEATLWRTIEQSTGNAVTRIARFTFTPWEWGKKKRELLTEGWTESRV